LRHETNKGVSAAILTGINAATTEIVASIDADCSYDPHELQHAASDERKMWRW
jgi:glycosyltransferase involved in cell wall biosynthesis